MIITLAPAKAALGDVVFSRRQPEELIQKFVRETSQDVLAHSQYVRGPYFTGDSSIAVGLLSDVFRNMDRNLTVSGPFFLTNRLYIGKGRESGPVCTPTVFGVR